MDETASLRTLPALEISGPWSWDEVIRGAQRADLEQVLAKAIATRRWFGAKTRAIESLEIVDAFGVSASVRWLLVKIHYSLGSAEVYQVPLGFAEGAAADALDEKAAWIAVDSGGRRLGVLYDAPSDVDFCRRLLDGFSSPGTIGGQRGKLISSQTPSFERLRGDPREPLPPKVVAAEQSNSSVIYGGRLILKLFRRVETGLNPDFEITEFLTRQQFANSPPLAGSLEYRTADDDSWALAMLQAFVPNQGDAWKFTLDWLAAAMDAAASRVAATPPLPSGGLLRAAEQGVSAAARAAFGEFLASVELLGERTAQMHLALAADAADPAFAPEPFGDGDRQRFFDRAAEQARETFALVAEHADRFSASVARQAQRVLALESECLNRYRRLSGETATVTKIRCHGDYHLGQVLVAEGDFVIIDFEGEPARPVHHRREKQLALRDVAGMIRSLHYASCAAAHRSQETRNNERLQAWTRAWYAWSSVAFLAAYARTAAGASFLPAEAEPFERLLDGCLLEKAIYELRYELNNRPDWVHLPLEAVVELLAGGR